MRDKQGERDFLDNFEFVILRDAFGTIDITSSERAFFDDIVTFYDFAGAPPAGLMMSMLMTIFSNSSFSTKKVACSTMLEYDLCKG